MKITVKEVADVEAKSVQEVENELLAKHEEEFSQEEKVPETNTVEVATGETPVAEPEKEIPSLNEEDVLSYIKNRYNKQIDSVDQLFSEREQAEDLPKDVSAYLKYKKETG